MTGRSRRSGRSRTGRTALAPPWDLRDLPTPDGDLVGPELVLIYNDAWVPILGPSKHPALGKPGAQCGQKCGTSSVPTRARIWGLNLLQRAARPPPGPP